MGEANRTTTDPAGAPAMHLVLTADQRGSRRSPDAVPALLERLGELPATRAFARTAGDEIQGVVDDPDVAVACLAVLLRDEGWYVGLGLGPVDGDLPEDTRAGRGPAFVMAREAVTAAKHAPRHLRVVGADTYAADQVETVLLLWAGVLARRTTRGWEVADLLEAGASNEEMATTLGITGSAVSQRAAAAGIQEGRRAARLAGQLLGAALGLTRTERGDGWTS